MAGKNLEMQTNLSYHYVFVGFATIKDVLKDINQRLPFYKFSLIGKSNLKEIFYDVENNTLSDGGIVLSKSISKTDTYLNIRRLSRINPRRNRKYKIDRCEEKDHPKDFAVQVAAAIEDSFSSPLSIDLESIVKKTKPKISLDIDKQTYDVVCGTGYRAKFVYENVLYKDIASGKKVEQAGITLYVPMEECKETEEILTAIERGVTGLSLYNESRFEIAQKLLYTEPQELDLGEEEEE